MSPPRGSTDRRIRRTAARRSAVAVVVVVAVGGAVALLTGAGGVAPVARVGAAALGDAQPYAVLAGGAVRGAGTSSIVGDVGGSAVGGLTGQVDGAVRSGDDAAGARAALTEADDVVASSAVTHELTSIGGTLGPGTYGFSGAVAVSGPVVLDAGGDADATFVLKTDSTLTAAADTTVLLAGGARACNVFWLAGGAATVDGTVVGSVLARAGITARGTVTGRLLSRGGDVTVDAATVRLPTDCDATPPAAGTAPPAPDAPVAPGAGSSGVGTAGDAEDGGGTGPGRAEPGGRSGRQEAERASRRPDGDTADAEDATRAGAPRGVDRAAGADGGARTDRNRWAGTPRGRAGAGAPDRRTDDGTAARDQDEPVVVTTDLGRSGSGGDPVAEVGVAGVGGAGIGAPAPRRAEGSGGG